MQSTAPQKSKVYDVVVPLAGERAAFSLLLEKGRIEARRQTLGLADHADPAIIRQIDMLPDGLAVPIDLEGASPGGFGQQQIAVRQPLLLAHDLRVEGPILGALIVDLRRALGSGEHDDPAVLLGFRIAGDMVVEDRDGVPIDEVGIMLADDVTGFYEPDLLAVGIEHQDGVNVSQREHDIARLEMAGRQALWEHLDIIQMKRIAGGFDLVLHDLREILEQQQALQIVLPQDLEDRHLLEDLAIRGDFEHGRFGKGWAMIGEMGDGLLMKALPGNPEIAAVRIDVDRMMGEIGQAPDDVAAYVQADEALILEIEHQIAILHDHRTMDMSAGRLLRREGIRHMLGIGPDLEPVDIPMLDDGAVRLDDLGLQPVIAGHTGKQRQSGLDGREVDEIIVFGQDTPIIISGLSEAEQTQRFSDIVFGIIQCGAQGGERR